MDILIPSIFQSYDNKLFLKEADFQFFGRVYNSGNISKYKKRIEAIDFIKKRNVLDAGCGYGQWTISLGSMNENVYGIDLDEKRIEVASHIVRENNIKNVKYQLSSCEKTSFSDGFFDCIFSYNAIMLGPYKETLSEFKRILKPGGLLYFNCYDIGWIIYNLIDQHNSSSDFSSRYWAVNTIINTVNYYSSNEFKQLSPKDSLYIPIENMREELLGLNFSILSIAGDGEINLNNVEGVESFYPKRKYDHPALYEVICRK